MRSVPDLLSFFRHSIIPDAGGLKINVADPYEQFENWIYETSVNDVVLPDTVYLKMEEPEEDKTENRIVVIKGFQNRKFAFFTNYDCSVNDESTELFASITLFWSKIYRRVKITGKVLPMTMEEWGKYNSEYPLVSCIHQAAGESSQKGQNIYEPEDIQADIDSAEIQTRWWGYYIVPRYIEFCHGRPLLLNYRIKYSFGKDNAWKTRRLFPLTWYG